MSRYYQIASLLDIITKIESDLVIYTEYTSLNIIPMIQHLFDRHCFYRHNPELYVKSIDDAENLLLEFDIPELLVVDAIGELDRLIAAIIDSVIPMDYSYNLTHRYLHHYSFLIEVYVFDSDREQISQTRIAVNEAGDPYVYAVPPISAYGS